MKFEAKSQRSGIFLALCFAAVLPLLSAAQDQAETVAGPLYSDFRLTLDSGRRQELLGPLFYSQQTDSETSWDFAPLLYHSAAPDVDWTQTDFLYPVVSYRRFGAEYRLHFLQVLSFSGGKTPDATEDRLFTLFPFYFQSRSPDPALDYTAVAPFYGHLRNRLFRDDIKFVMFPLYSATVKRDVVTDNYLYPFFHVRRGDRLTGRQFWPVFGSEQKSPGLRTNSFHEVETAGGYDKFFAVWPLFFRDRLGLGTTNEAKRLVLAPFYSRFRSPLRDESCYGWPFGYWRVNDREKKYREQDFLWPFFVLAGGEKTETRVFPFYSHAASDGLVSDFYLWPLYKFNRLESGALTRERARIAFFLYSNTREAVKPSGQCNHRVDFLPFFSWRRDLDGKERLQFFAFLESFFPNNRSITRDYAQLWSVWRSEKNPKTGASSQSLLWNLWRRETTPETKKSSFLFGLVQRQSGPAGASWRVCRIPVNKKSA